MTDIENKLVVSKGGRKDSEVGISRTQIITYRMDKEQGPMVSTRNYFQHNGKEYEIYIYTY